MNTNSQSRQKPVKNVQPGKLPSVFVLRELDFADPGFLGNFSLSLAPKVSDESQGITEVLEQGTLPSCQGPHDTPPRSARALERLLPRP